MNKDIVHHRAQRLAASQEKSRGPELVEFGGQWCSTPRGITGKIASIPFTKLSVAERAQRLAASQEKSPTARSDSESDSVVLNASRHHRKNRLL